MCFNVLSPSRKPQLCLWIYIFVFVDFPNFREKSNTIYILFVFSARNYFFKTPKLFHQFIFISPPCPECFETNLEKNQFIQMLDLPHICTQRSFMKHMCTSPHYLLALSNVRCPTSQSKNKELIYGQRLTLFTRVTY